MLVSMNYLLSVAQKNKFAIGAFNVADSCFVRAVIEEAEACQAPAIISIHPTELSFLTNEFFAYVVKRTSNSPVPFVIHLDHGGSFDDVMRAISCGFTSVMIDGSLLPYEDNVALTKKVIEAAHPLGISVEAELGTIGSTGTSVEGGVSKVIYTDPAEAENFVTRTGVDTLAVAIGTAHGIYPKDMEPKLKLDILADIVNRVNIPLVLHGGSANPDEEIVSAIEIGIQKVNISSDMKAAYFDKCREILSEHEWWDPNVIYPDCIVAAKEVIRTKMKLFNSIDKVDLYHQ
ncbi:ketose-bisphosphate aldolase [Celerinatantimonas diazotrophica]|uniref:Fructose-bisphosphate aldolase n=1 Tax=Celerinatantimonas diazotrophica TaxID=412034 RepID=A0A4V2PS64_9GAMM|nr:ketose-bisphosphate aldolase [Celerinatantimonas diazotrophica]TCK61501.1 fructose-bisphosphate aldolase [Celerinatantimonas diazotrophica]